MKLKSLVISILMGLVLVNAAVLSANAQYIQPSASGGDQILVNQPYNAAQPSDILAPASMMGAANAAGLGQPYSYATPYTGANAPFATPYAGGAIPDIALAAPCAGTLAAPVAACGPYTSGFTYSAQQSSSYGPFSPPVAQASEQFYQYPGLSPFGAYPGAGYAAAGGVGFDPVTGYYGPYSAYTPLI
jgi:hypothetical protein